MTEEIRQKSCIVVGGGTAGWLSACYIQSALGNRVKVSIIDPDNNQMIGVGESTLPTIHRTLKTLKIPLQEFIRETNATIKQGITFNHWLKNNATFYHPYDIPRASAESSIQRWYQSGLDRTFADFASSQPEAIRQAKSPFSLKSDGTLKQEFQFSLHVDATKITQLLKTHSKKIKVKHIKSKVNKVIRNNETVTSLLL